MRLGKALLPHADGKDPRMGNANNSSLLRLGKAPALDQELGIVPA